MEAFVVHSYNRKEMALFPYAPNEVLFGSPKSDVTEFTTRLTHIITYIVP